MELKDNNTVPGRLHRFATLDPNKPAFGFLNSDLNLISMTRKELWDYTMKFVHRIHQWGFQKGDVISNALPNSRTRLITDMGIMSAGTVSLNGSMFLTNADDIMLCLRQSGSKCIIIPSHGPGHSIFSPYLSKEYSNFNQPVSISCNNAPCLQYILVIDVNTHEAVDAFLDDLALEETDVIPGHLMSDDLAFIFTTSGTTSLSKLVPRSQREILSIGFDLYGPLVHDDILFNDRPLGWQGGFPFCSMINGAMHILQEVTSQTKACSSLDMWKAIAEEGVTAALLVPLEIDMFVQALRTAQLKSHMLRMVFVGGQPVQRITLECIGVITHQCHVIYGSTEAGVICNNPVPGDKKESIADSWVGEFNSDGKLQMKIVTNESNKSSKYNDTVGRILLKGPILCHHYLDVTKVSSSALVDDGWFDTGDVGYFDEFENLHVIGRSCDTIQYGSALVHPALLEEQLRKCPGVANIAIVGTPHPVYFQDICACIIPAKDCAINEKIVTKFCHETYFIDDEDVTTPIPGHYFFMTNFPVTKTGKLSKKSLREKIAIQMASTLKGNEDKKRLMKCT